MTIELTTPADMATGQRRFVDDDGIVDVQGVVPHSQLGQDLWVLAQLKQKASGVFVDVGAHDGIHFSNTYLLEKDYQWSGVCVECGDSYSSLVANRSAHCINKAAWRRSGDVLPFNQHSEPMLSGLSQHGKSTVETLSLNDICQGLGSIDYLSLDTEGSEIEILSTFDVQRFRPQCMTIEHNYSNEAISWLAQWLSKHGYLWRLWHWDVMAVRDGWSG